MLATLLMQIGGFMIMVGLGLLGAIFLRALTAKLATGKWPHQDTEAKRIFDQLP